PSKEFHLDRPGYESITFLPPSKPGRRRLTDTQIKHLKKHYITTRDGLRTEQDPRLMDMDTTVQVWLRCCVDKEVFHCEQNRLRNSTRLNHLAHVWQTTDRNANFREGVRPEVMEAGDYYITTSISNSSAYTSLRGLPQCSFMVSIATLRSSRA